MVRDDERKARSAETPIVGGLPDVPGIVAVMRLSPGHRSPSSAPSGHLLPLGEGRAPRVAQTTDCVPPVVRKRG